MGLRKKKRNYEGQQEMRFGFTSGLEMGIGTTSVGHAPWTTACTCIRELQGKGLGEDHLAVPFPKDTE